jgi:hypothetical protein
MSPDTPPVPERYRGVWVRTLLETPEGSDTTTFVRWLQTAHWHADLRVPVAAREGAASPERLALQQGFCGVTTVTPDADGEVCQWHRGVDFQPPRRHPDAGRMRFDGPDRVVETGIHGQYLEVWERLPGATGRRMVLESMSGTGTRLLIAGRYAMRVRPRTAAWPAATQAGDALSNLLQRHPEGAAGWLDFEISFGTLDSDVFHVERSTLPAMEGSTHEWRLQRRGDVEAMLQGARWRILEWHPADAC